MVINITSWVYFISLPIISFNSIYHKSNEIKICPFCFLLFSENETFFCWLYQSTICLFLLLWPWSNHYLHTMPWVSSFPSFHIQVYSPVVLNSCLWFKYSNYIPLLVHISHTHILSHIHIFEHLWHIMIKCLVVLCCLILE